MAVVVRFNTIIVRKITLAAKYPGGLDAYRTAYLPKNANFHYEDRHLVPHTSMEAFFGVYERLASNSLACRDDDGSSDNCGPDQTNGLGPDCPWLKARVICGLPVCWLGAEPPGHVVDFKACRFVRWVSQAGYNKFGSPLGTAAAIMAVDAEERRDGLLVFVDPSGCASARGYIVVCAGCGEGTFDEMGRRLGSQGGPAQSFRNV
ncbi:MAG: hypothetical protein ACLP9L_39105 [Thermoguttaceae bacterium]